MAIGFERDANGRLTIVGGLAASDPQSGPNYVPGQGQPQILGPARQTWQTVLANVMTDILNKGVLPGIDEVPAGLAVPLTDVQRRYAQQMIDQGFAPKDTP